MMATVCGFFLDGCWSFKPFSALRSSNPSAMASVHEFDREKTMKGEYTPVLWKEDDGGRVYARGFDGEKTMDGEYTHVGLMD